MYIDIPDVYVEDEVINEIWKGWNDADKIDFISSYEDDLKRLVPQCFLPEANVNDPAKLLEVIVELRRRGYIVEPGEEMQ